jgi:hypothetical protein
MSPALFVLIPALSCAIFAAIFLFGARARRHHHRRSGATWRLLAALMFTVAALALIALSVSIRHYFALEREVSVATLSFQQLAPQRFQAEITTADGRVHAFVLLGDQWQLDARVLTWRLPAVLAGAPPLYRIERIGGRYQNIDQERESERSVFELDANAGFDLGLLKQSASRWLPFVDTRFGSAAYMPMLDGGRFEVSFAGRGGLVARAADAQTQAALDRNGW